MYGDALAGSESIVPSVGDEQPNVSLTIVCFSGDEVKIQK